MREAHQPAPSGTRKGPRASGVTVRSVALMLILLPLNAYWVGQIECVRYWASPTMLSLFYNVVFLITALVGLNACVRALRPSWALTSRELATVYAALCVTSAMASLDCFQLQAVAIVHWTAQATPENQWAALFHHLVPKDVVVTDPAAIRNLCEGGSTLYRPEHYGPLLRPALWWASYAASGWLVTLCMASLFRRRWVESERLRFPILQVPVEVLSGSGALWRSRWLWTAAGIVFAVQAMNALHTVKPLVPRIPLAIDSHPALDIGSQLQDKPWDAIGMLQIGLYPFAIGLAFLLSSELVFSTVFFWWVYKAQYVLAAWLGWSQVEGPPYADEQMLGGYLALGLMSLWMARSHLRRVLVTALGREGGAPEDGEPWPYRVQLGLLAVGLGYTLWFAVAKTGMSPWIAPLFFGVYYTLALAVMRIRAEMGIPAHDLLVKGPVQSIPRILGSRNLSDRTLASFALHHFYNRGYRGHVAPHQIEALKLADRESIAPRPLFNLMWALLPVGALLTFWAAWGALYSLGAESKAAPNNLFYGSEPWNNLAKSLQSPTSFSPTRLGGALGGLALVLLMTLGHTRIAAWPVHPLGYPLGNCWAVHWLWAPLSIGWLAKSLTLRYGGDAAYRRASQVAIGMVLGDMCAGGVGDLLGLALNRMVLRVWS